MKSELNFVVKKDNQIFDMHEMGVWVSSFHIYSPNVRPNKIYVPERPGAIVSETEELERFVRISLQVNEDTIIEFDELKHQIYNLFFNTGNPISIIRDITPNREIFVYQEGDYDSFNLTVSDGDFDIILSMADPYLYGPERTANWPTQQTSIANFVGKVSGSTVENPHVAKFDSAKSSLLTPSTFTNEHSTEQYRQFSTLDGVIRSSITGLVQGNIAQHFFSFDLIAHIERKYVVPIPGVTTAEKVAWLKSNVKRLTCNWWGRGSGPSGNKAYLAMWESGANAWHPSRLSHSNSSIALIRWQISNGNFIDSNGFVHFLAYAEASNGTIASRIETDCPELEVETLLPQLPLVINNEGTADSKPIFELEVLQPVTFAMIQNQDSEYMMVGEPVDADSIVYEREELILHDTCSTTTGWTNASEVEGGIVAGTMVSDGSSFIVTNYGTGSGWHGPALKKSLPQQLKNFRAEFLIEQFSIYGNEVGNVQISLLDANNKVVGSIRMRDANTGMRLNQANARAGSFENGQNLISNDHGNRIDTWINFKGMLRLQRSNNRWQAYVALIDSNGNHHSTMTRAYEDTQGLFGENVAQIQVHIATSKSYLPTQQKINDIKVYKLNERTGIPYIANVGDLITLDHVDENILLNGESIITLKDFGAEYFKIKPGQNQLIVLPENSFNVKAKYRERSK